MANLAVLRNQGHSGSLWLTHLLNSRGVGESTAVWRAATRHTARAALTA